MDAFFYLTILKFHLLQQKQKDLIDFGFFFMRT